MFVMFMCVDFFFRLHTTILIEKRSVHCDRWLLLLFLGMGGSLCLTERWIISIRNAISIFSVQSLHLRGETMKKSRQTMRRRTGIINFVAERKKPLFANLAWGYTTVVVAASAAIINNNPRSRTVSARVSPYYYMRIRVYRITNGMRRLRIITQ